MTKPGRIRRLAEPLEELELVDGDDLTTLALVLDEVATLLAMHRVLASVIDVETEPLESLVARAAKAAGIDDATISEWVDHVAELSETAHASRYDGETSDKELQRAQSIVKAVIGALEELEDKLA